MEHGLLSFLATFVILVGSVASQSPCTPSPCGINTVCDVNGAGSAVCRCQAGFDHAPGSNTIEGCPNRISASAPRRPAQRPSRPRPQAPRAPSGPSDPCFPSPCGTNADCRSTGNRAVCSCPAGYEGDPYTGCTADPCSVNPCGANARCERSGGPPSPVSLNAVVIDARLSRGGNRAICKCPDGYTGDPFVRCNADPCSQSPCGTNADCESNGNRAVCKCRQGYEGDPFVNCRLNPCSQSPCGINADCSANGARAVCKCRPNYEGDPFVQCNLNPCQQSPCGVNADCTANGQRAVCRCRTNYVGDPFSGCRLEPCSTSPCGTNADCTSSGQTAVCKCKTNYVGDPYTNCRFDPCQSSPCGQGAICENNGRAAICKCPPQHIGDPYVSCRLDPCLQDACGPNADCARSGQRAVCTCRSGYLGSPYSRSGCRANPCQPGICGPGAECKDVGGRPVCECLPGHQGNPYSGCVQGECDENQDCGPQRACKDYQCVDPCAISCGQGADCTVQNHVAICRCPRGTTGDPFRNCRRFTREEICAPCGANTDCEVGPDDRPICRCKNTYIGNPLQGCRHECDTDNECGQSQKCDRITYRCETACGQGVCGENANCQAINHRAQCSCPPDFLGDAYSRCYTECTRHSDCASNKACVRLRCQDPCFEPNPNVCGQGATCEATNHKAVCSCPRGYTGDPFVSCRRFEKKDLCTPDPCGPGANCQPGFDRSGVDRPVCTCPAGWRGDPLIRCSRGECINDSECPLDRACYDYNCRSPCDQACGQNAECQARNHGAICSCPSGYVGDPLTACRPARRSQANVVGFSRFRRSLNPYFLLFPEN